MGILERPAQFVLGLKLPRPFSVCELGDQWVTYCTPRRLARDFYKELGCGHYEAIDGNGRGSITWDLNAKWSHADQFDLVTDFGTGEHIFNQAQVWRTLHVLTRAGGYIVFDRPMSGYPTHCFYFIQPCLIHDIADANGYETVRLEEAETDRGTLIRGVWRKASSRAFRIPQQGRYRKSLII